MEQEDKIIGANMRKYRALKGITQIELSPLINKCQQQIHKYENGYNGISGAMLWKLSDIFGIEVGRFFDGIPEKNMNKKEDRVFLSIVSNYGKLSDKEKNSVLSLVKGLAEVENVSE